MFEWRLGNRQQQGCALCKEPACLPCQKYVSASFLTLFPKVSANAQSWRQALRLGRPLV